METITLKDPLDMHLHLREGETLRLVAPYTARQFSGAVVMPNLKEPLRSTELVDSYKSAVIRACKGKGGDEKFIPFMTLFFHENLTRTELIKAKESGIKIVKLYPKGATTGSEAGVAEILTPRTLEVMGIMEELGLILSTHGESGGFVLEREAEFLAIYEHIARTFPRLKIIIEHMSDSRSLELIEKYENIFGTLTLHHLLFTLDDLLGGALNPHLFCKPIVKLPKDRDALLKAALSAHEKICFGSDSAPHPRTSKESAKGAAGIFSAPVLLPYLAELFYRHNSLSNLQGFVSDNAHKIYAIPRLNKEVKLIRDSYKIADEYSGFVPLDAGREISFRLDS